MPTQQQLSVLSLYEGNVNLKQHKQIDQAYHLLLKVISSIDSAKFWLMVILVYLNQANISLVQMYER